MPTNVNDIIFGSHMQHAVVVEMYNRQFNNRVQRILAKSDRDVKRIIRSGGNPDRIIDMATKRINAAYDEVTRRATKEVSKFVGNEVDFNNNLLKKQVGKALKVQRVLPQEVRKAVLGSRLDVGKNSRTFKRHITDLAKKETKQLQAGVRQALARGLTEGQAVDFIYDNPRFPAPNRLTRSQVRTLVRTSLTDVQSHAALQTFKKNSRIIEYYKYSATLDDRTSTICQRLDGLIQPVTGGVRPPQHYNCRSVIVPIVKAYEDIGNNLKKRGVTPATRSSINGQVPAANNYNDWLEGQSIAVQNSILGPLRAEVFREGRVEIKQMIAQDGRPLSVGAARRIDNDIIAGKSPEILHADPISSTLTTAAQFRNTANSRQINDFFRSLAEDNKSNYGTAHLVKKGPVRTVYDAELGRDVVLRVRPYDEQLLLNQLRLSESAVKQGAIKRADLDWILEKAKYLSRTGGMNLHQEIVFTHLMTKRFAYMRGYKGVGSAWKKNATIAAETSAEDVNSWLIRQSNLSDGTIRGRAKKLIQNTSVTVESVYDVEAWRKGINAFETSLAKRALRTDLITKVEDVLLESLDVKGLSSIELGYVTQQVTLELARGAGKRADTVAASIGRILAKRFNLDSDKRGVLMQVRLGAKLIDELSDSLNYRVVSKGREWQYGEFVENIVISPTTADKSSWINYSRNLQRQTKYTNQPNTKGKLAKIAEDGRNDTLGRKLISSNIDDEAITVLPKSWVKTYESRRNQQFEIDTDVLTAVRVIAKNNPELLRKGGFSENGILTQKYGKMIEVIDINKARKFGYNHFFDYRGRIYVRAESLSYNGSPIEKALHLNAKKTKWLDADVDDNLARFRFEAAEYLGSQKVRINGIERRISINTEYGRATIFEANRTRMLTLGNAILKGNEVDIRAASQYLKTFKAKNVAGVLKASVELARLEAHRAARGSYRGYRSGYRVGQDATASGPQIASMLLEDAALARGTNIIPTIVNSRQVKRSVYRDVAPGVEASEVWRNNAFLRGLDEDDVTALFKQPVMTTLYNVGRGTLNPAQRRGILGQLRTALDDISNDLDVSSLISDDELIKLANTVALEVKEKLPGLSKLTRFLDNFARSTTDANNPLRWQTPLTKTDLHYGVRKARFEPFEFKVGGHTRVYNEPIYSEGLLSGRTAFKTPPTIVHSLDADLAHWIEQEALRRGIVVQSNHDSFYANVQNYREVNRLYKDALIMLQEAKFLQRMVDDAYKRGAMKGTKDLTPKQQYDKYLDEIDKIPNEHLEEYAEALLEAVWPIS